MSDGDDGHRTEKVECPAYITHEQRDRWKARAEETDQSLSHFIRDHVEAGLKSFDAAVIPDRSYGDLRRELAEVKRERDQARDRVETLRTEMQDTERETVASYVEDNPGATFTDLVKALGDSIPERLNRHIDALDGDVLTVRDDRYYPTDDGHGGDGDGHGGDGDGHGGDGDGDGDEVDA